MRKSRPGQLHFAFAESPQGDGREGGADGSAPNFQLVHKAKSSDRTETTSSAAIDVNRLLELVSDQGNLRRALAKVWRNKGAPGVDRQTVRRAP